MILFFYFRKKLFFRAVFFEKIIVLIGVTMKILLSVNIILFFVLKVFSAGLAVKGNYRARGNSIRNLHFDSSRKASYRNYIDHRFRFNAAFVANDLIIIRSDIDFLGNCDGYPGSSVGCLLGHNSPDNNSNPGNSGLLNRWTGSSGGATVYAKRLWAEINTGYGILLIGRQPDSWGTGIYASSGDSMWGNYGDSLDRVQFDMKYGSIRVSPFYGNYAEGDIDSTADIYEMGFKVKYNMVDTKNVYGFYLVHRSSRDTENRLSTYDLFADHNFGIMKLELELVFQNGHFPGGNIDATGILARVVSDPSRAFIVQFEAGYASGTDTSDNVYGDYAFNPDYRPALILFAHEYAQAPFRMGAGIGGQSYSYPASVHNALYLKPSLKFKYGNALYEAAFLWAQRQQEDDRSSGLSLGYELDIMVTYQVNENLTYGADFGFFLPGDYYEKLDGITKDVTFALLGGIKAGVKF